MHNSKNVLVTGASTGIGRSITEYLAKNGFQVFAGARKQEDLASLDVLDNVEAIRLDVTSIDEIRACKEQTDKKGGIYALINNAGVAFPSSLVEMEEGKLKHQMDVNLFAANRMLQVFFEDILRHKGRVINVGSISGSITGSFGGAYSMSKFGLETYSEQLVYELSPLGIHVSLIKPGFFESELFKKADESRDNRAKSKYFAEMMEIGSKSYNKLKEANIKNPIMVAKRVYHSLTTEKPFTKYLVGNKNEQMWTFTALMNRILDVNEGLEEPWSKEELTGLFGNIEKNKK